MLISFIRQYFPRKLHDITNTMHYRYLSVICVMVVIAYAVGKGMETAFGRQWISSNTSGERSGTTPERVYRKQQGVSNRFSFPKVNVPNLTPDGSIRLIIKFILAHCGATCRSWLLIRFIAHLGAC